MMKIMQLMKRKDKLAWQPSKLMNKKRPKNFKRRKKKKST